MKVSLKAAMVFIIILGVRLPVFAELSLDLKQGAIEVRTPSGVALSGIALYVKVHERAIAGAFQPPETQQGSDNAGSYTLRSYRFVPRVSPSGPEAAPGSGQRPAFTATLELRHYTNPEVVVATLVYQGPPLAAKDGVQVGLQMNAFARGMALHRLKWWWLAPTFVSDPRLLAGDNVLLLWRRMQGSEYHLLAPLAGGGMVGALRVADFDEVRLAFSSGDADLTPQRIPLFVYASGSDPYRLAPQAYTAAFAANHYYGRQRREKPYPEIFRNLGWCSWNAYGQQVTEAKLLKSAESLHSSGLALGYFLIDDGWLSTRDSMLSAYQADPQKFPQGLGATVRKIHDEYGIPHVGVWHAFQGYWGGVDPTCRIGQEHKLFKGSNGYALWQDRTLYLPDPRDGAGESFYADWYKTLKADGIDFVKVDNQASTPEFTRGLLPVFDSSAGEQKNLQEAAQEYFPAHDARSTEGGANVINCMEMALEDAFNWRYSNVARNSDDYFPDDPADIKNHTLQNAYNSYWTSNFGYPDWDEFETGRSDAEYQAIGRAMSGGPVYFTGGPETLRPEVLRPLILSGGRLLMLDAPSMPTRDSLLTDTSMTGDPLKIFGTITRPGLRAEMVAAFNVDKAAQREVGNLDMLDAEALINGGAALEDGLAVYDRSTGKATVLDAQHPSVRFSLGEIGSDLFTLAPANGGAAVFGLLDKYLGPAGVVSVERRDITLTVTLAEAGDFGAYLAQQPQSLKVDGKTLPSSGYGYSQELLKIPASSFAAGTSKHTVEIELALSR